MPSRFYLIDQGQSAFKASTAEAVPCEEIV